MEKILLNKSNLRTQLGFRGVMMTVLSASDLWMDRPLTMSRLLVVAFVYFVSPSMAAQQLCAPLNSFEDINRMFGEAQVKALDGKLNEFLKVLTSRDPSDESLSAVREALKDDWEGTRAILAKLRESMRDQSTDFESYFIGVGRLGGLAKSELPHLIEWLGKGNVPHISGAYVLRVTKESDLPHEEKLEVLEASIKALKKHPLNRDREGEGSDVMARLISRFSDELDLMKKSISVVGASHKNVPAAVRIQDSERVSSEATPLRAEPRDLAQVPTGRQPDLNSWVEILENPDSSQAQLDPVFRELQKDKKLAAQIMRKLFDRNVYKDSDSIIKYWFGIERLGGLAIPGISELISWIQKTNRVGWRGQDLGHVALAKRVIEESDLSDSEKSDLYGELSRAVQNNSVLQDYLKDRGITAASGFVLNELKSEQEWSKLAGELQKYNITFGDSYSDHVKIIDRIFEENVPASTLFDYLKIANRLGKMSSTEIEDLQMKVIESLGQYSSNLSDPQMQRNRIEAEKYLIGIVESQNRGVYGQPTHSEKIRFEAMKSMQMINGVRGIPALLTELDRHREVHGRWHGWITGGKWTGYDEHASGILSTIESLMLTNQQWRQRPDRFDPNIYPSLDLSELNLEDIRRMRDNTDIDSSLRNQAKRILLLADTE